jgi:general secretion pathway protein G
MKNKKAMLAGRQGFTLVELLISISIIAILSVVLTVSFSNAQKSSRDQRRIEDLKAIQNAAEQYYLLNGNKYPTNSQRVYDEIE